MTKLDKQATRREQIYFGLALVAVLILLFRMGDPLSQKIDMKNKEVGRLQTEREALAKFIAGQTGMSGLAASEKKRIKSRVLLGELKPASEDVASLFTRLTDPEFLGGVLVQQISHQPAVAEGGYVRIPFKMNLLGDFSQLTGYLNRMDRFPALFHFNKMTLKAVEGQPREMQAEIEGIFFQRESGG